jgi:RNA polymerase sigma-70 factor (ECF subfamily)
MTSGGGDRERAFVDLYERHYGAVLAYAWRRVGDAAARDVAAETFLVAWRRLDEALAWGLPWLYRTAQLTLRNWERGEQRAARTVGRLSALLGGHDVPDPAVDVAERQRVLGALQELPAVDRELLLLVVWEQLDVRTAAGVVGCSATGAAVRLHRARRRLRGLLADPPDPRSLPGPPAPDAGPTATPFTSEATS